jgi:hypothetical protein
MMRNTFANEFSKVTYGEDYVFLGFIPGSETGLASLLADIRGTVTVDFYGTPIDELPIMNGVNTATDFDLVFDSETDLTLMDGFVRQVSATYEGVKLAMAASGGQFLEPYYPDQVQGLMYPLPQAGAEYEILIKSPGNASSQITLLFVASLFFAIGIGGGSIYRTLRSRGRMSV